MAEIEELDNVFRKLDRAETEVFSELVELAGLDPAEDFVESEMQGVDFKGSDLSAFNFSFADLRGATWDDESISTFRPPEVFLTGYAKDVVSARDFEVLSINALSAKTWGERFQTFAFVVDNFGSTFITLDLLEKVLKKEKGTYGPTCAITYYFANFFRADSVKMYCRIMAEEGNSQGNLGRIQKVRRYLLDFADQGQFETWRKWPVQVHFRDILDLYKVHFSEGGYSLRNPNQNWD